jgi:predicted TPR repeat methyltransferase
VRYRVIFSKDLQITRYLLGKRPDFRILGIDNSENMVKLAKKNNPGAQFKLMDGRKISSLNRKFDVILSGFVIPYLSFNDFEKLIADCRKLLSDPGLLYISFVEGDHNRSGYISDSQGNRMFFYYYTIESVIQELNKRSFTIQGSFEKKYEKSDGAIEFHNIIIASKINHNE